MSNKDDIKAVVGNIPIKSEKKKNKVKTKKDDRLPLGWKIFVAIMAIMMFLSFAGGLIALFISAISNK